jgi:predicted nucleic acid-binding protein
MPYLLDADWAINALAKKRQAHSILIRLASSGIAISWITVGELYEGAFESPNPEARLAALRGFLQPLRVLGINGPTMERFAEIRSFLRRQGQLIPDFDIILAATALQYDLTVLTFNTRHIGRVPEVRLYRQRDGG